MILRIKGFELEIEIKEDSACVLEILDKRLFRSIVTSIIENIQGIPNNEVVIENKEKIINYTKEAVYITNYFELDINSKSIIQSLYKGIEKDIQTDVALQYEIENVLLELSNLLWADIDDYNFSISKNTNISIVNVLKLFDFKINMDEYSTLLEKLYLFIDLNSQFNGNKLLVFINIKSNFDEKELVEIFKYLIYKKMKFICIESCTSDIINSEIKYVIDQDLIEFGPSK